MDIPAKLTGGPWLPKPRHPFFCSLIRLSRVVLALLVLGVVLLLVHRPILTAYAGLFRIDDPVSSDLIILLLGGPDHRPDRAAELYRQGLARKIVFCTSGEVVGKFTSETQVTAGLLKQAGVPESAIVILPDPVMSTRDEAVAVRHYLESHPAKRAMVVTSAFHSRRALWVFRRVLSGLPIELHAASVKSPTVDTDDWYLHDESLIVYFTETVKTLVYWVRF